MFIYFLDYVTIQMDTMNTTHYCKHTSGGTWPNEKYPTTCYLPEVSLPDTCHTLCSSYGWCIGYIKRAVNDTTDTCNLITSTGNCTIGKERNTGYTATTSCQIAASEVQSGFSCFVKSYTGNTIL